MTANIKATQSLRGFYCYLLKDQDTISSTRLR